MENLPLTEKKELALWRKDLEAFGFKLLKHYRAWLTGVTIATVGLLFTYHLFGDVQWTWTLVLFLGVLTSSFAAWREAMSEIRSLERNATIKIKRWASAREDAVEGVEPLIGSIYRCIEKGRTLQDRFVNLPAVQWPTDEVTKEWIEEVCFVVSPMGYFTVERIKNAIYDGKTIPRMTRDQVERYNSIRARIVVLDQIVKELSARKGT